MFLRRGPDLAYNAIGALWKGQTASVIGKDILSEWLLVRADAGKEGWLSARTSYTQILGDLQSLPVVEVAGLPAPAMVQNCTLHEMLIEPIGAYLPGVASLPNNVIALNPGVYTFKDNVLPSKPEVSTAEVKEGSWIDVRVDGTGNKSGCPGK